LRVDPSSNRCVRPAGAGGSGETVRGDRPHRGRGGHPLGSFGENTSDPPGNGRKSGSETAFSPIRTTSIPASRSLSSRRVRERSRSNRSRCPPPGPPKRLPQSLRPWRRSSLRLGPLPPPRALPRHQAEDFVRAGEFSKEAPKGIGNIQAGRDPKVGFVAGDQLYLSLRKEIPEGQLLGVYRVRGPVDSPGKRSVSGYVSYLIGVIQAGPKRDGQPTGRVRQSFEDLTRADLISEEIPAYTPVRIDPGADGIPSSVITARLLNEQLAQGDFIYLDQGVSAGVAVGNVFRLFVPTGAAPGAAPTTVSGKVLYAPVARAVVVRVSPNFSTAYVTNSTEPFAAGASARRGYPRSRYSVEPGVSTTARHLKHDWETGQGFPRG